ncbi:MAG: GTPase ObgE [Candidatus Saccharibacteria bacterium]|nr:GTPase ObgE [Candidatus Saccharibacteria bacterium]
MFVDNSRVLIKAGDGGGGIVSFHRTRGNSKGGPDGGDGGHGGDVVFMASKNQNTLANFRYQKELKAEDGNNGYKKNQHGKNGKDLIVAVPIGTQIRIKDKIVADLTEDNQKEVVAIGGTGGFGNAHFISSTRQTPRFAEKGEKGDEFEAELELKIIADVGLVGLPNAGKSTFLSKVSSAKPKIANYPFTTLNPHLGVVKVEKGKEVLIADIPGLIDGASEGKGLGDEFLRHVERTQVILHMIDSYSDDVVRDYETIQKELKNYKIDLSGKPQVVALTKIEGLDAEIIDDQINSLKKVIKRKPIFAISALSGVGVQPLLYELFNIVVKQRAISAVEEEKNSIPIIKAKINPDQWTGILEDGKMVIRGEKIERFANRTNFENEDAVRRLRDIMFKLGIIKVFEKQKLEPETKIYFGENRDDYLEY